MVFRFVFSFIGAIFPTELAVNYLTGTFGTFLGALIGVPTYTPTLVEVFLIKALIIKGMGPAAALAFLIGGPMISIRSMIGVSRIIGWKTVISYAIFGVFVAFFAGLAYRAIVGNLLWFNRTRWFMNIN